MCYFVNPIKSCSALLSRVVLYLKIHLNSIYRKVPLEPPRSIFSPLRDLGFEQPYENTSI